VVVCIESVGPEICVVEAVERRLETIVECVPTIVLGTDTRANFSGVVGVVGS